MPGDGDGDGPDIFSGGGGNDIGDGGADSGGNGNGGTEGSFDNDTEEEPSQLDEAWAKVQEQSIKMEIDMIVHLGYMDEQFSRMAYSHMPFMYDVIKETLDYRVDNVDYTGNCNTANSELRPYYNKGMHAVRDVMGHFYDNSEHSGRIGAATGRAVSEFAVIRNSSQERRKEREQESKLRTVIRAHAGTYKADNTYMDLHQNILNIRGGLLNGAIANFTGSAASYGSLVGQRFNVLSTVLNSAAGN